jgi:hypothetical protein
MNKLPFENYTFLDIRYYVVGDRGTKFIKKVLPKWYSTMYALAVATEAIDVMRGSLKKAGITKEKKNE